MSHLTSLHSSRPSLSCQLPSLVGRRTWAGQLVRLCLSACLLSGLLLASPPKDKGARDEAAVRKANQQLMVSLIAQDRNEIATLLHEDLLYSHSDTRVESKQQVLDANSPNPKNNIYRKLEFIGQPTFVQQGKVALLRGDVAVNIDRADGTKSNLKLTSSMFGSALPRPNMVGCSLAAKPRATSPSNLNRPLRNPPQGILKQRQAHLRPVFVWPNACPCQSAYSASCYSGFFPALVTTSTIFDRK